MRQPRLGPIASDAPPPRSTVTASPRNGRGAANAVYSLANFAWVFLLSVVATPYIVHGLGADAYGIFALTVATFGFLGFLDLGMVPALVKFVSEAMAKRDYEAVDRAIGTSFSFYALMGGVIGVFLFLIAPFLVDVLRVPPDLTETGVTAFRLIGGAFFLFMLSNALQALPVSVQRYDIYAKVSLPLATALTAANVGLVKLGQGVVTLVAANVLLTGIGAAVYLVVGRRLVSFHLRLGFDRAIGRRLFSFGAYAFIASMGSNVLFYLDKFLVGSLLGVGAVTFYVVPNSIAMILYSVTFATFNVLFPASSELFTLGDREGLRRLYSRATRTGLALLATLAVPLLVFSRKILEFWLGGDFPTRSTSVFIILILTCVLLALHMVAHYFALGAGKAHIVALFQVLWAGLNIGLIFVLVKPFGLAGVALAYLLSLFSVPLFILLIEKTIIRISHRFWLGIAARVGPPACLQALLCLLVLKPLVTNLGTLVVLLAAGALAFPVLYLGLGFAPAEDRELLRSMAKKTLRAISREGV